MQKRIALLAKKFRRVKIYWYQLYNFYYMTEMIQESESSCKDLKTGTKEWAESNINICYGCKNNCRYCYAKKMAIRFGRETEESWKKMRLNHDAIQKGYSKRNGTIMFPSTHDITPEILDSCITVLIKILKAGNRVLITTKPNLKCIQRLSQELLPYQENILFRFTIGSLDNNLIKYWEENAPLFEERYKSLQIAFELGYETSISIEPFLDYDPEPLVNKLNPFVTHSIWIGRMNYIKRKGLKNEDKPKYDEIRKNYSLENIQDIYNRLRLHPKIKWKDSIKKMLELY